MKNVKIGNKFRLNYTGQKFPYEVRKSATESAKLVLVNTNPVPLGVPLNAIPVDEMDNYDFEKEK